MRLKIVGEAMGIGSAKEVIYRKLERRIAFTGVACCGNSVRVELRANARFLPWSGRWA